MKRIFPLMIAVLLSAPFASAPAATTLGCQTDCMDAAEAICPYSCATNTCRVLISGSSYCCECDKQGVAPRGCRFER